MHCVQLDPKFKIPVLNTSLKFETQNIEYILILNVRYQPLNTILGALYGPLTPHTLQAPLRRMNMKCIKVN